MKNQRMYMFAALLIICIGFTNASCGYSNQDGTNNKNEKNGRLLYAREINGVLCGYSEFDEFERISNEKKEIVKEASSMIMLSLLGNDFNNELRTKTILNPESKRAYRIINNIKQGPSEMSVEVEIIEGKAVIQSPMLPEPLEIEIDDETIIGTDELMARLNADFILDNKSQVEYKILETLEASIQTSIFRKVRDEQLELNGKLYNTSVIEQNNQKTGLNSTYWISPTHSYYLMLEVANRRIYLSNRSVVEKLKVANVDMDIFTKTNTTITDPQSISYLKVNAVIEPKGQNINQENLSTSGQIFSGNVDNNRIEGIFEISHSKYNGELAPPFPEKYEEEWLQQYLIPEPRIESDNPELVAKAKEITKGSMNSWEAATRLSSWVWKNINYDLPGGGTAVKTYQLRAGECGSQSFLLTALGRAVGIPTRVVWGAIYTPIHGGGFGQHAWNEVYMDKAGWIPVDASAGEVNHLSSGHIRIAGYQSVMSSFNGKSFDIIDYKLYKGEKDNSGDNLSRYAGKYINTDNDGAFEILVKDGSLAVDIPNKMTLTLKKPDEKERWFTKLIPTMYIEFNTDNKGAVNSFLLHELSPMVKKSSPQEFEPNIPDTLKPFLGTYIYAYVNKFTIGYQDETIFVNDPTLKMGYTLKLSKHINAWVDKSKRRFFSFSKDQDGNVTSLTLDVIGHFVKGEFASEIVEETIRREGIESGLLKYKQLKEEKQNRLLFTEGSFNSLGYKFLAAKKYQEAIEIFTLLVAEYPDSFNAYDSLGEAYMLSGNKEQAVMNYEKSIELNPQNENGKKMLLKLNK